MKLKIKKLHPDAVVPKYQTKGAAGFDIYSLEDVTIVAGATALVRTGLAMAIESGYELQIRPRSSKSLNTELFIKNSPGTIDSDYRGEVCIIVKNNTFPTRVTAHDDPFFGRPTINLSGEPIFIAKGDRIAQGVISAVTQAEFEVVEELDSTERGSGGFGSTGQ